MSGWTTKQVLWGVGALIGLGIVAIGMEPEPPATAASQSAVAPPTTPVSPVASVAAGELTPTERADCAESLRKAETLGLIKDRPTPSRIDVEETLWAGLPAKTKQGILGSVSCEVLGRWMPLTPGTPLVAYGYHTGNRLAMLSSVGMRFE